VILLGRIIDLSKYYPSVVKDTENFEEIAKVENPEFNLVNSKINDAFSDQFIFDATENGVKRWEKILKIYPLESDSLDMRKSRIILRINRKIPYTYRVLGKELATLFGEKNYNLKLQNNIYYLEITVKTFDFKLFNEVMREVEKIIPCNLILQCIMESDFNSQLKLETHYEEFLYPYFMCGTFLCGTKPDINNLGTKVAVELKANINNEDTKQKYLIVGTFESGGDTI